MCVWYLSVLCIYSPSTVFWTFDFCFVAFERTHRIHTHQNKIKWNFSKFICSCFFSPLPPHFAPRFFVLSFRSFVRLLTTLFRFSSTKEKPRSFTLNEIIVICSRFNGEEINSILLNSNEFGIHLPVLFHHNFSRAHAHKHTHAHPHKQTTKYFHLILRL